jgi:hypothetical protein
MIGMDIGFGDVKVAYLDGLEIKAFKFSNAIRLKQGSMLDAEASEYEFLGKSFIVTPNAHVNNMPTTTIDYLMRYSPLLAYRALKGPEMKDAVIKGNKIAVGLPIGYFNEKYKTELVNGLTRVIVNKDVIDSAVSVLPQAVGILFDFRLNEKGRSIKGTDIDGVILDVGYNTVDVVIMEKGEAVGDESDMLPGAGITWAVQALQKVLKERWAGYNTSDQLCKEALLTRSIRFQGEVVDLSIKIDEIMENYIEHLKYLIDSKWGKYINSSEKLIVAGGGAYYLKANQHLLPESFQKVLHIPEAPEFSNARGYLKSLLIRG